MSEYKTANLYFVMGTHLFVLGNMTFMKGTHQSQHKGAMSILAALALMFGNKALSGDEWDLANAKQTILESVNARL